MFLPHDVEWNEKYPQEVTLIPEDNPWNRIPMHEEEPQEQRQQRVQQNQSEQTKQRAQHEQPDLHIGLIILKRRLVPKPVPITQEEKLDMSDHERRWLADVWDFIPAHWEPKSKVEGQRVCKDWFLGRCRKGTECRFSHTVEA
jgi:hypothetical protein